MNQTLEEFGACQSPHSSSSIAEGAPSNDSITKFQVVRNLTKSYKT